MRKVDHLGTPRWISNASRGQVGRHDYFAFGQESTAPNQNDHRMRFTGHERDANVTLSNHDYLDYMHARYYSPTMGRFLSVDPVLAGWTLLVPQGWNRYSYTLNNPIKFTDPTGRVPKCHTVAGPVDPETGDTGPDQVICSEEIEVSAEDQILGIKAGTDMARFEVQMLLRGLIPDEARGSASYFRGVGRGSELLVNLSGLSGKCAQQQRLQQLAWTALLLGVFGSPDLMAAAANDIIGENKRFIAGRVGTGVAVTALGGYLGKAPGARVGFGVGALAIAGDFAHFASEVDKATGGSTPCSDMEN